MTLRLPKETSLQNKNKRRRKKDEEGGRRKRKKEEEKRKRLKKKEKGGRRGGVGGGGPDKNDIFDKRKIFMFSSVFYFDFVVLSPYSGHVKGNSGPHIS